IKRFTLLINSIGAGIGRLIGNQNVRRIASPGTYPILTFHDPTVRSGKTITDPVPNASSTSQRKSKPWMLHPHHRSLDDLLLALLFCFAQTNATSIDISRTPRQEPQANQKQTNQSYDQFGRGQGRTLILFPADLERVW